MFKFWWNSAENLVSSYKTYEYEIETKTSRKCIFLSLKIRLKNFTNRLFNQQQKLSFGISPPSLVTSKTILIGGNVKHSPPMASQEVQKWDEKRSEINFLWHFVEFKLINLGKKFNLFNV